MVLVKDSAPSRTVLDTVGQAALLAALWVVYAVGRHVVAGSPGTARHHAAQVWSLERDLRLPDEGRLQDWVLRSSDAVSVVNLAYKYVHFPAMIATLLFLLIRRREAYRWIRDVLVVTTGLALIGHAVYPLAPPRLVPRLGVVDTGLAFGDSAYDSRAGSGFANQFAAMPSMHVAWAAIIAIAVVISFRTRWRWLVLSYPCAIVLVVVVTGNHYWMDGIVGLTCLAVAAVARSAMARR